MTLMFFTSHKCSQLCGISLLNHGSMVSKGVFNIRVKGWYMILTYLFLGLGLFFTISDQFLEDAHRLRIFTSMDGHES